MNKADERLQYLIPDTEMQISDNEKNFKQETVFFSRTVESEIEIIVT